MKTLPCIVLLTAYALAQSASHEQMVTDRDQTRPADETQTLDRGRPAHKELPGSLTWNGTLVDAGCRDRTNLNLHQAPEPGPAPVPSAQPANEISAHGITVNRKTLAAERSDITPHQVPDMISREADPTCAITGGTRAFALLLDSGRLVNLNEGGNTLAIEALQSSAAGWALLAGTGAGLKPRVTVEGRLRDDRILVDKFGPLQVGRGSPAGR